MKTVEIGTLTLAPSDGRRMEACWRMISSSASGTPVFENLSNFRFTLQDGRRPVQGTGYIAAAEVSMTERGWRNDVAASTRAATKSTAARTEFMVEHLAQDSPLDTWEDLQNNSTLHANLNATSAMRTAEREAYSTAAVAAAKERGYANPPAADAWSRLRSVYLWPDGQHAGGPLESMFSPYDSEGIYTCAACQPKL